MKIKLIGKSRRVDGEVCEPDKVIDVTEQSARYLVRSKKAVFVEDESDSGDKSAKSKEPAKKTTAKKTAAAK